MTKQEEMKRFVSLYLRQRFTTNEVPDDECDKEAEFIQQYLHSQGVVIKVERELPKLTQDEFEEWCGSHQIRGCGLRKAMCEDYCVFLAMNDKAGYVAVESLIKD